MTDHEQLLEQAWRFCDPNTGEVLARLPDELMSKLRAAGLARGVPGKRNEQTETYATWFVFLSDGIRDRVMAEWREANRQAKRHRKTQKQAKPLAAAAAAEEKESKTRGLGEFRQRRNSAK